MSARAVLLHRLARGVAIRLLRSRLRALGGEEEWPTPALREIGAREAELFRASYFLDWHLLVTARSAAPLVEAERLIAAMGEVYAPRPLARGSGSALRADRGPERSGLRRLPPRPSDRLARSVGLPAGERSADRARDRDDPHIHADASAAADRHRLALSRRGRGAAAARSAGAAGGDGDLSDLRAVRCRPGGVAAEAPGPGANRGAVRQPGRGRGDRERAGADRGGRDQLLRDAIADRDTGRRCRGVGASGRVRLRDAGGGAGVVQAADGGGGNVLVRAAAGGAARADDAGGAADGAARPVRSDHRRAVGLPASRRGVAARAARARPGALVPDPDGPGLRLPVPCRTGGARAGELPSLRPDGLGQVDADDASPGRADEVRGHSRLRLRQQAGRKIHDRGAGRAVPKLMPIWR